MLIELLQPLPLVAILRGVQPFEAVEVADALVEAGFRAIEVPLNSPEPFESIKRIAKAYSARVVVGAGTVLDHNDVDKAAGSGGKLVVAPNLNPQVVGAAKRLGLFVVPGVFTPTEAFSALDQGADMLKLFPAELMPPVGIKALRAVLPATAQLMPVGGVKPESIAPYRAAGAAAFGIGSALYKPGLTSAQIAASAKRFAEAWKSP